MKSNCFLHHKTEKGSHTKAQHRHILFLAAAAFALAIQQSGALNFEAI